MIFNGRDITTFWFTKDVKFDTSYYTDFERQEVASRGLLRSYLEVPTVRKIVVSIVCRAVSKYVLDQKIHEIADWLYSSGEAHLLTDRDASRYYIARCTAVEKPTFRGSTATFGITFTCSDFRPYNSETNQPIGDATTDLSNFTFNNKHCLNDMHCLFVLDSMVAIPKVNRNAYTIAGRDGTLRYDDEPATLDEKTLTGFLYFLDATSSTAMMSPQDIAQRQHDVASWLVNAKRARLIFDSDTSRYYEAEVIDQSEISFDKWTNGALKIKMTLQPYSTDIAAIQKSGSTSIIANMWLEFPLDDVVSDVGYTTPLIVAITNNGTNAISDLRVGYYDESNAEKYIRLYDAGFSLSAGQTVTINSLSYDVLIGSTSSLKSVKTGDFPVITPSGNKRIRLYSNVNATLGVSVTMNRRWL